MTVLDAYAVIAYLRAEPAGAGVRTLLNSAGAALTAVGVAEVLDHLIRIAGTDEEDATLDLAQLGLLDAIPVSATLGGDAGRLRARRYHRTRCPVSMADCVAAEAARSQGKPLATSDPYLLTVCHLEAIDYVVLPGSDSSIWKPPAGTP